MMMNEITQPTKAYKSGAKPLKKHLLCVRCEWSWKPRIENPAACPQCKSYEWKGKKIK